MEESEQELKPKTRKPRTVRKEKTSIKNIEQQISTKEQVVEIKQVPPITKSSISDVEVAKKLINIYQSAQDRKLQFNLSFEYVRRMLEYKTCYYTNKLL